MRLSSILVVGVASLCFRIASGAWAPGDTKPNIIFLLADDLGYADVSWNNAEVLTPHMKTYAEQGVILDQFYTQPTCSPSRAALMTGRFPIHTGFNEGPLGTREKNGLESAYTTLADQLKSLNYTSHMLGKWHLGNCKPEYQPHHRGFETFNGIYHSGADHYTYDTGSCYDLHENDNINLAPAQAGTYSEFFYRDKAVDIISNHDSSASPLFLYMAMQNIHGPSQAPSSYLQQYRGARNTYGWNGDRKTTAAMVTVLDDVFYDVIEALDQAGMLQNSVLVFASDNGGQPKASGASNLPLRGGKNTYWEGGLRVPSFIYSPLLDASVTGSVSKCLFDMSDWFTTLVNMAGNTAPLSVDGVDQWVSLNGGTCQRTNLLHNIIDTGTTFFASYRKDEYKLIWNDPGSSLNGWYHTDGSVEAGPAITEYHLFNILDDEEERNNLAYNSSYAGKLQELKADVLTYVPGMIPFTGTGRCDNADLVDGLGYCTSDCCV